MDGLTNTADNPFDFTQFIHLLGLFGNIFAIILFVSPFLLIIKLHRKEIDPEQFPYLIMMMNVMNCFLWLSYGILIDDFFIKLANGIGYPINLIYLCLFFFYRANRSFGKSLFFILFSIIITGGLLYLLASVIQNTDLSKFSAMIFNIFMYAAPGQNIIQVIRTGNFSLIPLPNTIIGFLSSITWLLYGIMKRDISIIIPNALGVLFSIINLGTYSYFYLKQRNHPLIEDIHVKDEEKLPFNPNN